MLQNDRTGVKIPGVLRHRSRRAPHYNATHELTVFEADDIRNKSLPFSERPGNYHRTNRSARGMHGTVHLQSEDRTI